MHAVHAHSNKTYKIQIQSYCLSSVLTLAKAHKIVKKLVQNRYPVPKSELQAKKMNFEHQKEKE